MQNQWLLWSFGFSGLNYNITGDNSVSSMLAKVDPLPVSVSCAFLCLPPAAEIWITRAPYEVCGLGDCKKHCCVTAHNTV